MKKVKKTDEISSEYKRDDLGAGVRGKYFEDYNKGTNLVLLSPDVANFLPKKPSTKRYGPLLIWQKIKQAE